MPVEEHWRFHRPPPRVCVAFVDDEYRWDCSEHPDEPMALVMIFVAFVVVPNEMVFAEYQMVDMSQQMKKIDKKKQPHTTYLKPTREFAAFSIGIGTGTLEADV